LFWAKIEALAPGHPDLRIGPELYEQWRDAVNTRENGQGVTPPLEAAGRRLPVTRLALYEPPYIIDDSRPAFGTRSWTGNPPGQGHGARPGAAGALQHGRRPGARADARHARSQGRKAVSNAIPQPVQDPPCAAEDIDDLVDGLSPADPCLGTTSTTPP
jgi:hypothetical protein